MFLIHILKQIWICFRVHCKIQINVLEKYISKKYYVCIGCPKEPPTLILKYKKMIKLSGKAQDRYE